MQEQNLNAGEAESPAELAKRLNLSFENPRLLTRALTHRSYVNENPGTPADNERLEFLGDAVLDFIVGAWVYERYPEMPEGELTKMRSALVRTETLASFARELNLGSAMRLGRGELNGGGGQRDAILCATFEALIGAIYQDKGLDAVRSFVLPIIEPSANNFVDQYGLLDSKSRLQEWSQAQGLGVPQYKTISVDGPNHAPVFEIEVYLNEQPVGRGIGSSKQSASQVAAQNALENKNNISHPKEN